MESNFRSSRLELRNELKKMAFYLAKILAIFLILAVSFGCRKFVTVGSPNNSLTGSNVFNNDATAIAVMTNLYINMSGSSLLNGGITSVSLFCGLSADELTVYGNSNQICSYYYSNTLTNSNTGGTDFWNAIYPMIYVTNSVISGLTTSEGLTPAIKQQLLGEAMFMRAFCYFYLVNLYGDVPLVLTTDYVGNASLPRTPSSLVWRQIIDDLSVSNGLLSENYLDATLLTTTTQRVRPTKWSALALLSRVYLFQQKWDSAEMEATMLINNGATFNLENDLNGVFLDTSLEAIWQLQPVASGENTSDALTFILPSSGPGTSYPVFLSSFLLNAFEPTDQRRLDWVDSVGSGGINYYFPFKYKVNLYGSPVTECSMVFRLGEQYLIRAEAEAELNDLVDAADDLNVIRGRAGLANTSAISQFALLSAVYHERQVELFTEWGHRWLDLKRTGIINSVMGSPVNVSLAKTGISWNANWELYPISLAQLQYDPNVVQNGGY